MARTLLTTFEGLIRRDLKFQDRCWTVRGETRPVVRMNGQTYTAARLIAALFHELDLMDNRQLACHRCNNPRCIRPSHIYKGNKSTNALDKEAERLGRSCI